MDQLVVLNLGEGDFQRGFPVTLQVWEEGCFPISFYGKLPPSAIDFLYDKWQSDYRQKVSGRMIPTLGRISNYSDTDLTGKSNLLKAELNNWLNSETFRPVRDKFLTTVKSKHTVRVIIQTENPQLRRLPWYLWDSFVEYCPFTEMALSSPTFERVEKSVEPKPKVRILAILGDASPPDAESGIRLDINADKQFLESLPDAETVFLVEPKRHEFNEQLWDKRGWDILFFAGHSISEPDGTTGKISINHTEYLTIDDLKYALKESIYRGLQLAIFNSCDGLGIARDLAELQIPQIIVMREPVADFVAKEFLKYFLDSFSKGQDLYLAVRKAREKLHGLENSFTCASWLPVICQNLAEIPVNWKDLCNTYNPNDDSNLLESKSASITFFQDEQKPDSLTSAFYIERPPIESDCCEEILKPGSLIRIRAPQMMGKSLLLDKIIWQARKHDYRTVVLGFKLADSTVLTDTKVFLKWFCARVTKFLELPNKLDDYWDDVFGCNSNATDYFEEYLLAESTQPLVVALDNVDLVFEHSVIAKDFCSLLRGWYDMTRRNDRRGVIWKRLRLVVVHSTEVYNTFDINRSPLAGVGKVFPLSDFGPQQVQELAQLYGLDWLITQIEQLIAMVGGHPYLVSQAFDYIERHKITLEEFVQVAPTESSPFSDHLREQLWNLQQNPALAAACREVVTQNKPVLLASEHTFKLQSMGLVQLRDNNCIPRCELYRQYFSKRLAGT